MHIIGITGPSGCGKGYLSAELAKHGYVHADADAIYHALLSESVPLREALVRAFGKEIERDGVIDRKLLGKKVFGAKNKRRLAKLNKITHAFVCREYVQQILACKAEGNKGILLDAPLLIEARLDKLCDLTVCVLASEETRIERIMARDGISRDAAWLRIRSQKPLSFYAERCDYLFVNNDGSDAGAAAQEIEALLTEENRP